MKTLSYFNPFIESFLKGTSKETIYDVNIISITKVMQTFLCRDI